ncbi:MAG: hypothetical protein HZC36_02290 [Armatimonadetes bacterium]|nr:hypothetical protein [Armatimonadota bacterium]
MNKKTYLMAGSALAAAAGALFLAKKKGWKPFHKSSSGSFSEEPMPKTSRMRKAKSADAMN